MMSDHQAKNVPLIAGVALFGLGLGLSYLRPREADLLDTRARPRLPRDGSVGELAGAARDTLSPAVPDNIADGVGRSLMIAGGGLLALQLLDALAGDDGLQ